MKKRLLSLLIVLCMVFTMMPAMAFATEGNTPIGISSIQDEMLCEHHTEHDEICGYAPSIPEVACSYKCEECNPLQENCSCEIQCTAESISPDCPVCGAESADLEDCTGIAAQSAMQRMPRGAGVEVGSFTVTGGALGTDYSYASNVLTVLTNTPITIANTDPGTATTDRIEVTSAADITLNGVNIDMSSNANSAAFKITDAAGAVNLTLADGSTNTLKSGENCAGLQKDTTAADTMLTIQGDTQGTGALSATGGLCGAGIGGARGKSGSYITIREGTITASGGKDGAGIGGGSYGSSGNAGSNGSNITISGGTVTATGNGYAAAIGGGGGDTYGVGGNGTYITISGGTVIANGSRYSAGIGAGTAWSAGTTENIVISGGNLQTTSIWGPAPSGGATPVSVYKTTFTVPNDTKGGTDVSAITFTSGGTAYTYNMAGAKSVLDSTDGKGKVYVYLPGDTTGIAATASYDGKTYTATVKDDGNATFVVPPQAKWGTDDTYAVGSGTLTEAMTYANGLASGTAYIQLQSDVDTTDGLKFMAKQSAVLDLNGFDINRGLTSAINSGFVLEVWSNLTLKDTSTTTVANQGKITGGNSKTNGGGVLVGGGPFIMEGGNITGNSTEMFGGGVVIQPNATFTMTGGTISGNTSGSDGGGVYVWNNDTAIFTVGGTAQITGNTKGTGPDAIASNVYLAGSMSPPTIKILTISTTTPLAEGASIGVTSTWAPSSTSPVEITGNNSADYSKYFISDNSNYLVKNSGTDNTQVVQLHKKTSGNNSLTVTVNDNDGNPASTATVTITDGSGKTTDLTYNSGSEKYIADGVTDGKYTLVVKEGDVEITIVIDVKDGMTMPLITLPSGKQNTVVETKPNTPPTFADMNDLFTAHSASENDKGITDADKTVVTGGGTVELKLVSEKREESATGGDAALIKSAGGADKTYLFLDLSVFKTVTPSGSSANQTKLSELNSLINIVLEVPQDMRGTGLKMFRVHGGVAEELPSTGSGEKFTYTAGEQYATLTSKKFSTYALGYTHAVTPPPSGGSGSSYNYYDIEIIKEGNGTISPDGGSNNTLSIRANSDKTFTFTPDKGYMVSDVLVDGKSIGAVSKHTFENVKTDHTLKVIFKANSDGHVNPQTGVAFEDVQENDWFIDSVYAAVNNGWFTGTSDTTFSPYISTTRGMIATVLHRMENQPNATITSVFDDVTMDSWYYNGVTWAQEHDIVKGYGDGTYGPQDNITREQMASILYRYAKFKGYDVSMTASLDNFKDGGNVSAYATETMKWAVGANLISGKGDKILDPRGNATRAEVTTILTRFEQIFSEK